MIKLKLENTMINITVPKKEYQKLVEKALRYEYVRQIMEGDLFASPPTKNIGEIIGEFRKTRRYDQKFLESLEKGLKHSSYFKE